MRNLVRSFATGQIRTSPLARRYAAFRGVDPTALDGSGPGGRVVVRDVVAAVRDAIDGGDAQRREQPDGTGCVRQEGTAELTLHITAAADRLVQFAATGTHHESVHESVCVADLVLFAVARTLPGYPALNAHYLETIIRRYSTVDLGVLREDIIREDGAAPASFTIPRADTATISEIARYRSESSAAGPGKLAGGAPTTTDRHEVHPGVRTATFTCAVFDAHGPDLYTPLLIPPQVGLLGIGPVTGGYGGPDTVGPRINLSLTIDHRALDGAPAARFLSELVRRLEAFDPALF
jgi:pyruvate dehydrogenase E2 component (dihydrolipoamide acetyltransferase)